MFLMPTTKRQTHSKHVLAQAVFHSVYSSREQRQRRQLATVLLAAKHTLRGLLFSWPLYLMALGGFHAPVPVNLMLWAIAVPGIGLSLAILARGVRAEYRERVAGRIQKRGDLAALLKGGLILPTNNRHPTKRLVVPQTLPG
jgi:hypothetical protein